ncbi:hypothetical protein K2173_019749 [Erythroxylum novogranatense]|uniref:Uncharacterized protein n=1 Tax=Erythroxylum novogranatense TaxID=1862640 RepID=A0AAV8SMU1_9ROSI|nr:hypothetical protein K2173_019749 [Erythroxylum novogranatense]
MNAITHLINNDGSKTSSLQEVHERLLEYFMSLLGVAGNYRRVDDQVLRIGALLPVSEHDQLVAPITETKIKMALFDIGDDKAPCPDGYTATFFKKQWHRVGQDVIQAVQEFFQNGKLLKQLNHSFLSLIPKTNSSPKVTDFRPIACLNVVYKIITKILMARLSSVVGHLVDSAQAALIPGRNMLDNVYLALELVKGYSRKRVSPGPSLNAMGKQKHRGKDITAEIILGIQSSSKTVADAGNAISAKPKGPLLPPNIEDSGDDVASTRNEIFDAESEGSEASSSDSSNISQQETPNQVLEKKPSPKTAATKTPKPSYASLFKSNRVLTKGLQLAHKTGR